MRYYCALEQQLRGKRQSLPRNAKIETEYLPGIVKRIDAVRLVAIPYVIFVVDLNGVYSVYEVVTGGGAYPCTIAC